MSTFTNYKRAPKLTAENQKVEVTFNEITEVVEKETDTTKGFFVKTEEFQDIWVPFFGCDKNSIEFENLQDELGIEPDESGDLTAYNAKKGSKIIVSGVQNGPFINAHFGNSNPIATPELA